MYFTTLEKLYSFHVLSCLVRNPAPLQFQCSAEWLKEANFKQVSEKIQYCIHSLNHEKNKNLIKNLNSLISY